MIERLLVPMDDSEMAETALRYALDHHPDASITVLHVVGEPTPMMGEIAGLALADDPDATAEAVARPTIDRAETVAEEYGTDINVEVAVGHPARTIVNRAADFDAVVIGSHGGALVERLFVGNVARRVFERSPVPVTVVR